jgi:hypothetical protein
MMNGFGKPDLLVTHAGVLRSTCGTTVPLTMTEFKFRCPACQRRLRIGLQLAGAKIRCPDCQSVISVPLPGQSSESDNSAPGRAPKLAESGGTIVYWRRKKPPTSQPGAKETGLPQL